MTHPQCLSPARARRPVDVPVGPSMYGRLFPDLPSFSAEEELLFALGRGGGLCDCGDEADEPASLAAEAAGWPSRRPDTKVLWTPVAWRRIL